jgi:hypothetical protein
MTLSELFQRFSVNSALGREMTRMFDELPEPLQVLLPDSPHPLVEHRIMGQLTAVVGGTGWVCTDGVEYEVSVGDLILIAPRCSHAFLARDRLELRHHHWPQAQLDSDRYILTTDFTFRSLAGGAPVRDRSGAGG